MTKEQLAALPAQIKTAAQAGLDAAAACPNDGGSANLDRVVIRMRDMRESAVIGLPGYLTKASTRHPRGLHLDTPFPGQGNQRAAGVRAMHKSLQDQGVDCYVYYQVD
ncbi:hypothetical protein [Pseudomonas abieticivorans]|uniref:hypothetical protein n=1 Tax=Pseudomonas abieticivorans TaxID=2931382 RepID=UPI0020BE84D9|nr:hypothetical protein [Pseudomonas sp. PIA16]